MPETPDGPPPAAQPGRSGRQLPFSRISVPGVGDRRGAATGSADSASPAPAAAEAPAAEQTAPAAAPREPGPVEAVREPADAAVSEPAPEPAAAPAAPAAPAPRARRTPRAPRETGRRRGRPPAPGPEAEKRRESSHRSLMLSTDNLCYLDDAERDILRGSDYTVTVNRSLLLRAIIDGLEMADFDLAEVALKDPEKKPQLAIAEHIAALLGAG